MHSWHNAVHHNAALVAYLALMLDGSGSASARTPPLAPWRGKVSPTSSPPTSPGGGACSAIFPLLPNYTPPPPDYCCFKFKRILVRRLRLVNQRTTHGVVWLVVGRNRRDLSPPASRQGGDSNVRIELEQLCEHCSQEVLPVLTPLSGGVGTDVVKAPPRAV